MHLKTPVQEAGRCSVAWEPSVAQLAAAGAGYCEERESPDCELAGHMVPVATTQLCLRRHLKNGCSDKTLLTKGGQVWCN